MQYKLTFVILLYTQMQDYSMSHPVLSLLFPNTVHCFVEQVQQTDVSVSHTARRSVQSASDSVEEISAQTRHRTGGASGGVRVVASVDHSTEGNSGADEAVEKCLVYAQSG